MKKSLILAYLLWVMSYAGFALAMQSPNNPNFITSYGKHGAISLLKPDLNAQDNQLWHLIFKACQKETSEKGMQIALQCLSSLKEKGANLNADYRVAFDAQTSGQLGVGTAVYTPLVFAIASRKDELVNRLIDLGAQVNGMSTMGSPFQAALTTGNIKILPTLLARGADINLRDEWGQTALFGVLYHKELNLFNFLYSHPDLDCTIQDNQGQTPLHYEVLQTNPNLDIVRKLLARGANPHVQDRLGRSALDYAREGRFHAIIAVMEGREPEGNTDNFLVNTLLSAKHKKIEAKKNKKTILKKSNKIKKVVSPKKRTESEVAIEHFSPTKKLREALDTFNIDSTARKELTFSEDTYSHECAVTKISNTSYATFDTLAPRVQDWFNQEFLAQEKATYTSLEQFARSVYYHQIPLEVINCIIEHGQSESRASQTIPDDIGTKYYLRGEMVFENQSDNPWITGRKYQPGYYHCTKNAAGQIYHVGFDAIKDAKQSLSDLFTTQKFTFNGTTAGIQHTFTI